MLEKQCQQKGLATTGVQDDLVRRILGKVIEVAFLEGTAEKGIHLREEPKMGSSQVAKAMEGTLNLIEHDGKKGSNWLKVRAPGGEEGWILDKHIKYL